MMNILIDTVMKLEDGSLLVRITKQRLFLPNKIDIVTAKYIDNRLEFNYPTSIHLSTKDKLAITIECCSFLENIINKNTDCKG